MNRIETRIAIVGGGLSGLALGVALRDRVRAGRCPPVEVTVLEVATRPGGKIHSLAADGFRCESGPNGFLNKEPLTTALCQRLGLELMPAEDAFSKRYIFRKGQLREVSMRPLQFMMSPLLPLGAKFRLAAEPWIAAPEPFPEDETVADFGRRRIGPDAFRLLIDPMQSGIYAGDPERMSVVSCFPRVVEVEREYGSLVRGMVKLAKKRRAEGQTGTPGAGPTGHLTSMAGGISELTDALARELGSRLNTGYAVEAITRSPKGSYLLHSSGRPPLEADHVVLACPAYVAAKQLAEFTPRVAALLGEIDYSPMCVVTLGFEREQVRHPLDGFGFLAPRGEGLRLLGSLFSSSIFRHRAPDGHVLVRVMLGGARDLEILRLSSEELVALVLRELGSVLGFEGAPVMSRVFRHEWAIPQYNLGHGKRLRQLERLLASEHRGLFLAGNAYRGIGINDCVKNAELLAEDLSTKLLTPALAS